MTSWERAQAVGIMMLATLAGTGALCEVKNEKEPAARPRPGNNATDAAWQERVRNSRRVGSGGRGSTDRFFFPARLRASPRVGCEEAKVTAALRQGQGDAEVSYLTGKTGPPHNE